MLTVALHGLCPGSNVGSQERSYPQDYAAIRSVFYKKGLCVYLARQGNY
uniref:Uncharacterized protein n=1 Tax=Anguilla anguilla TaxID=7936 RepID=A0A0E9UVI7_ANGAN